MVVGVPDIAQPPITRVVRVSGWKAAEFPPQLFHFSGLRGLLSSREPLPKAPDLIVEILVGPVPPPGLASRVLRDQDCLGKLVQLVHVYIGKERGQHAPNAKGNFCFEATLGYRRVERGR